MTWRTLNHNAFARPNPTWQGLVSILFFEKKNKKNIFGRIFWNQQKDFPLTWNGDRLEIENVGFRSNNSYPTDENNDPRRVF